MPKLTNPDVKIRPAHDAEDDEQLKRHPEDKDAKLDIELDESFPASDPPSQTNPAASGDPVASSGAPKP